ncbi:hypothetical protein [Bifidobacterium vansinderenii]|uniref:Uncharacterized protein n=1 Tax=Bifidobacterium vansinderenii TaxID=1984871 RepID=A0A229VYU5_9BIFI|nr:hypothetical protein [Bifidobacterium vansinderenii]OXN00794.1 hypothetical protein Tam10B_0749 [Bifidobacterium vansinderenii]
MASTTDRLPDSTVDTEIAERLADDSAFGLYTGSFFGAGEHSPTPAQLLYDTVKGNRVVDVA